MKMNPEMKSAKPETDDKTSKGITVVSSQIKPGTVKINPDDMHDCCQALKDTGSRPNPLIPALAKANSELAEVQWLPGVEGGGEEPEKIRLLRAMNVRNFEPYAPLIRAIAFTGFGALVVLICFLMGWK